MKKTQLFNQVPVKKPNRSFFDLSHEVKMSGKMGYLYPVLVTDCLPGDTFRNTSTIMLRFAPMLAPIMHRVNVTTHFFFVPNRILMDQKIWENFITGGQSGANINNPPYVTPGTLAAAAEPNRELMAKSTLWDYLGLPPDTGAASTPLTAQPISAFPFLAYQKIWNDYYRDPNFDNDLDDLFETSGGNLVAERVRLMSLRKRGWQKDYFTSCLPFAQRGSEVLIPLTAMGSTVVDTDGFPIPDGKYLGSLPLFNGQLAYGDSFNPAVNSAEAHILVENSEVTINDLRTSIALQAWLENNARGGARYIEQIQSHFAVTVPDYRLTRAEYLGGGMQPVQISEVLSTAKNTADDNVVGDMAGHGISVGKSNQFTYRCQEHGWVLGIMSITPITAYQQGIDRMWLREDRFDYAWPEFAHLGEQEVLSREVFFAFADSETANNNATFGYIPRYSEYKFKNDRVAGDFRDNLSFWHLGRIFSERPALGSDFTTMSENSSTFEESYRRIFAVETDDDYLWINVFHRFTAKRPLPYFGVPKLIG